MNAANAYYEDTALLDRQAIAMVMRLWTSVDVGGIGPSWTKLLPNALAILVAAETVAAELADPYLAEMLEDTMHVVSPGGMVRSGLESLLYRPVIEAKTSIASGLAANLALERAGRKLSTYVHTDVADTARLAVTTGMAARPHVGGYYRRLRPPSCARCSILAGKFYKWNTGFKRHPRCDCVHVPAREADNSLRFNPRKAIEAGEVTGLSKNELTAIRLGANPSQVVNARQGMYDSGQFQYTTTGTTRQGVAGARILAKDIDRALGLDVSKQTYTNVALDRQAVARFAELFRQGKTFTRLTKTGREQQYAYRFARTPRPTPSQIIASVGNSRDEAVRLLTNYGYLL